MNKTFEFLDGLKTKTEGFNKSLTPGEGLFIHTHKVVRDLIWMAIGLLTYHYIWL